jgi:hypothetical protein
MDVYDTKKITQHFKYEGEFKELENFSVGRRKAIDEMELTDDDINFFESIREKYITNKPGA